MFGWSSLASVLASVSKRLTKPSSWNSSDESAFSATSRPRGCCTARYTTAMPPPPRRSTISYWPSRVPVRSFIAGRLCGPGASNQLLDDACQLGQLEGLGQHVVRPCREESLAIARHRMGTGDDDLNRRLLGLDLAHRFQPVHAG